MSVHCALFCKIIDHYGDMGVCWRLACQLAQEHQWHVQLWVNDSAQFLNFLSKSHSQIPPRITIYDWSKPLPLVSADCVIEAFACTLPEFYLRQMAQTVPAPVWFNLEYLCVEPWGDDYHLMPSPHPQFPLKKIFFLPGFSNKTGGLLREAALLSARAAFTSVQTQQFWQKLILPYQKSDAAPDIEQALKISLFCYQNPVLLPLLQCWAQSPRAIFCVVTDHQLDALLSKFFGVAAPLATGYYTRGAITILRCPFLSSTDYDHLLWSCDLNFVRGEDSFVRAQWAQKPLVWQAYPQKQSAHWLKVDAFLARYTMMQAQNLSSAASQALIDIWFLWNQIERCAFLDVYQVHAQRISDDKKESSVEYEAHTQKYVTSMRSLEMTLSEFERRRIYWQRFVDYLPEFTQCAQRWADDLARMPDLATQLVRFYERNRLE